MALRCGGVTWQWIRPRRSRRRGVGAIVVIDRSEVIAALVSHIDRNHPQLGQRLMKMRWGGMRTFEPDRWTWLAVLGAGAGVGNVSRLAVRRVTADAVRVPIPVVSTLGPTFAWFALWRWDTRRWRRRHVTMVLDLTEDRLEDLLREMDAQGLIVDRWEAPRSVGGPAIGLSCRAGDLRRVSAVLDELEPARSAASRPR